MQYIKQNLRSTQKSVVVGLGQDQGQIFKILDPCVVRIFGTISYLSAYSAAVRTHIS